MQQKERVLRRLTTCNNVQQTENSPEGHRKISVGALGFRDDERHSLLFTNHEANQSLDQS